MIQNRMFRNMLYITCVLSTIYAVHVHAIHMTDFHESSSPLAMVYGVSQVCGVHVSPTTSIYSRKNMLCTMHHLALCAYIKSFEPNSRMVKRPIYALMQLGEQLYNMYGHQVPYAVTIQRNNIRYIGLYQRNSSIYIKNCEGHEIIERVPEQSGVTCQNGKIQPHCVIIRKRYTQQPHNSFEAVKSHIDHTCPCPHIFEVQHNPELS